MLSWLDRLPIFREIRENYANWGITGLVFLVAGLFFEAALTGVTSNVLNYTWNLLLNFHLFDFIVDHLFTLVGFGIIIIVFYKANSDVNRRQSAIERRLETGGLVIQGSFHTMNSEGQSTSIHIIVRNEEPEEMEISLEAGAPWFASFTESHWQETDRQTSDLRLVSNWHVPQNTIKDHEIARTKGDGFWFTPHSGTILKSKGYFRYWIRAKGVTKKSNRNFWAELKGYVIFHGGTELKYVAKLPTDVHIIGHPNMI